MAVLLCKHEYLFECCFLKAKLNELDSRFECRISREERDEYEFHLDEEKRNQRFD